MMIFPPLLNPMFWERPGNIPALTRLLVSYLSKAGQEIVAGGGLQPAGFASIYRRFVQVVPTMFVRRACAALAVIAGGRGGALTYVGLCCYERTVVCCCGDNVSSCGCCCGGCPSGGLHVLHDIKLCFFSVLHAACPAGQLTGMLGVFQKLIASKANDMYGFMLLRGIVEYLPLEAYQQYMPTVWQLLFTRLQVRGRDRRTCTDVGEAT